MTATFRLIAVVALWLAAGAGVARPNLAEREGNAAAAGPLIRVCYNEQLGPPNGGHFSLQLMRAVVAATPSVRFDVQALPWMRCLILASRGEIEAILGASFTPERALDLAYPRDAQGLPDESRRLFAQGYRLLRRRGESVDTDGQRFTNLVGRLGVERGYSAASFARASGTEIDDNHPDLMAMLAKLRSGRLGAALVAEPQYATLRGQAGGLDGLESAGTVLQPRAYYLVFSSAFAKREPALVEQLWNEASRQRDMPVIRRETARQQAAAVEESSP